MPLSKSSTAPAISAISASGGSDQVLSGVIVSVAYGLPDFTRPPQLFIRRLRAYRVMD